MVRNINNLGQFVLSKMQVAVFTAICFLSISCRSTKQTQYVKNETTTYRDTTINVPMELRRFDVNPFQFDTTIIQDDVRLQIIKDSTQAMKIFYMKSPQTIKLDSVIQNTTIKEVYKIRIETQVCHNKFHQFTTSFFQWAISLALLYAGIKAITK